MKKLIFKAIDLEGMLTANELERDTPPKPGEAITIFNYPVIERYVVDHLAPRNDHFENDWFQPMCVFLRRESQLEEVTLSQSVPLNNESDLRGRLASIFKIARKAITSKFRLEISHTDFVALCQQSGLPSDVAMFDAIAYHDIPVEVGEVGADWNASTCFTGFSDDMHVFYVTLPGGCPFAMNPQLLEIASQVAGKHIGTEKALGDVLATAMELGLKDTEGLQFKLGNALSLIRDRILPVYDGGQELTRLTLPTPLSSAEYGTEEASPPVAVYGAHRG